MFFRKKGPTWFTPVEPGKVFARIAHLVSIEDTVHVLHEQTADDERMYAVVSAALDSVNISHIQLSSFLTLADSERKSFRGAIISSHESFASNVISQWLPQRWGGAEVPEKPVVALNIEAASDARASRVFLPLRVQSAQVEWRELNSVIAAAWVWLSGLGGVSSALDRFKDDIYNEFYLHITTIVGRDDDALRSICYQSIGACIKSDQTLVDGVHYVRMNNAVCWAGKDGSFSPSNMKDTVIAAAVSARLGIPHEKRDARPEVIDVHPLSLLRVWKKDVFGVVFPVHKKRIFSFKDSTLAVSDSLKGQNVLLQQFISHHKDRQVFVLVNDSDYLNGLSGVPAGIHVMTHACYMVMQTNIPSNSPVICLQMPKSERALLEILDFFCSSKAPFQFALCGHDSRLGAQDAEWLSIATRCALSQSSSNARRIISFWCDFWGKSTDASSLETGEQYRLDALKVSVLCTAFGIVSSVAGDVKNEGELQEKASQLGLAGMLSKKNGHMKLTPHVLWVLFLVKVQEHLMMHRLGSVLLPVQLSLASEKTSHDMEEMKAWKSLQPQLQ